jgi:phosphotriesterase-related protein
MTINTVLGPVRAEALGATLSHEHLFLDLRNEFTEPADPAKRRLSRQKITLAYSGLLRRNPYALKDNLVLDDFPTAVSEVKRFRAAGGRTIVDCTSVGIRRDVRRLRRLAQVTGVNIIAGCGYYTYDTHPPQMDTWSAERIADEMVRDLTVGIDGTGIRAGVIGEIGTSDPVRPNEWKNLSACALAQRRTGAGIQVHTHPWGRTGPAVADVLMAGGVAPSSIAICHVDVVIRPRYLLRLLARGVFVQFDNFGKEFWIDPADRGYAGGVFAHDPDRVRVIADLVKRGYERQILISNDICLKCMLHRYGGWGYDHVIRNVPVMLREAGVPPRAIQRMRVENPRVFLAPSGGQRAWEAQASFGTPTRRRGLA